MQTTRLAMKPLFNPDGRREPAERRLVGGSTTNLIEFNHARYPWAEALYRKMRSFFWIPEEVPLGDDKQRFLTLTEAEQRAYLKTLSFLIFLDSIQPDNLGILAAYVTDPEVDVCLKTQAFFETIHAQSYDYILTSVVDARTREQVYTMWRDDPVLLQRNRFITDQYERFIHDPTETNFLRSAVANFCLEGIYFYSGFAFFYTLGRQDKMSGTVSVIRLIQRDENTHLALFTEILRTLRQENPEWFTPEMDAELADMIRTAVAHEIAWGTYVTQNRIAGLPDEVLAAYIRYLGNQRAQAIGLGTLYPEATEHPLPWLDAFASLNATKTDFFEAKVGNYHKAAARLNFDRLRQR
ncbi:Ribonucleoside-diphosphate reductase subunit beta [Candidatus Hydrogenisulfobacillus filiaventi]|uniref:Ribonucleoside-diphosphate reductase subunit beta n=1 Tax=Candidatus Hydrogenisulfobacillus filiaventi TaxID=2707344 RepID=A0A6F8ZD28_9FIRM|nr:ribonucleotide-diphosphate reductase subunit beta [Bacillota bacterium]CAB1127778.1 Ribonucleoside-diphosphate reductase subunit beta [Candidatus Hydrogenisulfobacillus filiaventi]